MACTLDAPADAPAHLSHLLVQPPAGGQDAVGYHALNLALHLGAVLLLYECLRRLLPTRPRCVAAAIFAVHPLQAEAVDYVWGRSIVLASLFCLAALLAWLRGRAGRP